MREIKFRAWSIEEKSWVYMTIQEIVNAIYFGDTSALPIGDEKRLKWVTLFTGLKDKTDKNDKGIYGGDIVKYIDYDNKESILLVKFGKHSIGFDGDCAVSATGIGFHFEWIRGGRLFLGTPYIKHLNNTENNFSKAYLGEEIDWDSKLEVIGNKFENPNLLKTEK